MRQSIRQPHVVETKKETQISRCHLQKRDFVLLSFAKRGAGFGIDA